jgi:hypothetical protein
MTMFKMSFSLIKGRMREILEELEGRSPSRKNPSPSLQLKGRG